MKSFEDAKIIFNKENFNKKTIDCFLPIHTKNKKFEKNIFKKDGTHNEQYYKWEFLYSFVNSNLCDKDYIGTEIQFPKGNKNSASIKIDAVIFDDANWKEHYDNFWTKSIDTKWDELDWLKNHILCAIEFKKENGKNIKAVFNSQLKAYMNESFKNIVFGILYDEGRLYLFKSEGKKYYRLSDEFNIEAKKGIEPTYNLPDAYKNLLSYSEMINYDKSSLSEKDYSGRNIDDLFIISKTDSKKLNDALYKILHTMDKCGLVNQRGYNILIQTIALKIYDEKHNSRDLQFYVNQSEIKDLTNLTNEELHELLSRIENIRTKAMPSYSKILNDVYFDHSNINHVKEVVEIVKQLQNYSFIRSERNNLYQLVFYEFASKFSKTDNAQFITPLQIIDFVVDIINPKHNESIIDPTVGIADFLSVSYVKSNGKLDDTNVYGMDIDEDMVKLATLNMLLNGDGNATIEAVTDGLGSLNSKYSETGEIIKLIPKSDKNDNNYNGDWDNRIDKRALKKFDIVLTNPPFGEARSWEPKGSDVNIAECYEIFNRYHQSKIDLGVIFLENAVRVLKENGRMAIVLSNSIASIDAHSEARKWLMENMRIVAIIDLPPNVFAEAGVSPTIIFAYKPNKKELNKLIKNDYEVFSKEIKKVGYEVKTKNKVKVFEPKYKINAITFEKEINSDGTVKLDEEFTNTISEFKDWCVSQEKILKELFL